MKTILLFLLIPKVEALPALYYSLAPPEETILSYDPSTNEKKLQTNILKDHQHYVQSLNLFHLFYNFLYFKHNNSTFVEIL